MWQRQSSLLNTTITDTIGDLLTVNDVGWNLKIINNTNYNSWLSEGDKKEIPWANLKRQYLHCYDYCKTALDEKTLSEDEMKNEGTAWKRTATSATTEKKKALNREN